MISIASHLCVACFYLVLEKREMQTAAFWHPRYRFIPVGKLLCDHLHGATSCLLGLSIFRGYFSLLGALASTTSQPRACKAPVGRLFFQILEVSSVPPSGPLLHPLCRKMGSVPSPDHATQGGILCMEKEVAK